MLLVLLMMACSDPPPPPAPEVVAPAAAVDSAPSVSPEDLSAVIQRLDGLEDRLARLELLMAEMQEGGRMQASEVSFDPSRTRLDAKDAQAALTELYQELDALQRQLSRGSMGQPGAGLFELPRDGPKGPANPNGGPQGGGGGKGGDPYGGKK
ncbi:MAG: hypothetical protein H6741_10830 [Alphaproteobacteria bacterium]|nr:hypothetical protein [Alphaproteobacteria bacterium]MCB9793210.1 hypothetical protein [Alphaproteobacteria bacterium]